VILTDQAGAADLIEPGVNGLIVPARDSQALAEALRWCLDNRQQLVAMREAAVATARQRQWSDYRQAVTATMRQALAQAGYPLWSG
jgi:glycosyltransferase involved in cell wall biosynthesis